MTSPSVDIDSIGTCVTLSIFLVGIGATLTWGEFAYLFRAAKRDGRPFRQGSSRYAALEVQAWLGLVLGIATLASVWMEDLRFGILLGLAVVTASFARSTTFGREGSDEVALVTVIPLAIAVAPGASSALQSLALLFVGGQLVLAYLASAGAKLAGQKWRDGLAVAQILSTRDYGVSRPALHSSQATVLRLMTWGTIALELTLPTLFVLGGPFVAVAAFAGAAFHASVAAMMGLNRFLPWFLAAYPAAIWASLQYGLLSA